MLLVTNQRLNLVVRLGSEHRFVLVRRQSVVKLANCLARYASKGANRHVMAFRCRRRRLLQLRLKRQLHQSHRSIKLPAVRRVVPNVDSALRVPIVVRWAPSAQMVIAAQLQNQAVV